MKKITVTGAAGGIGSAIVKRIVGEGHSVIAVDLPGSKMNHFISPNIEIIYADLTKSEDRDRIVDSSSNVLGLVNAAGVMKIKPLLDFTIDEIRKLFEINFEPVWDLTARIGKQMSAGGSIVNISSSGSKTVTNGAVGPYSATKAAINSLTRSFAFEFSSKGVRVNAICPGIIDTPMQDYVVNQLAESSGKSVAEIEKQRISAIPLKRVGTVDECANLIWFLLSNESSYMTGQAINVTGGWISH